MKFTIGFRHSAVFFATAMLAVSLSASAQELAAPAIQPEPAASATSRDPLVYRLLSALAVDLDETLQNSTSLEPISCRFRDDVKRRTFAYEGLGPCLYRSWRSGTKTDGVPGLISASLRAESRPDFEIKTEISWRSAHGGLWDSLTRFVKTRSGNGVPPQMRGETFPGTVTIRFVEPVPPELILRGADRLIFAGQSGNLERLEFTSSHDEQTGREMMGKILFYLEGRTEPTYEIAYRTDKNIFRKRPYFLELDGK